MLAPLRVGAALFASPARAANTFKINLILPMTSGQASTGRPIDIAITFCIRLRADT
jgi:branched-chain amino acid transport system substrate-binding protein